jgi:hypothetical protein
MRTECRKGRISPTVSVAQRRVASLVPISWRVKKSVTWRWDSGGRSVRSD